MEIPARPSPQWGPSNKDRPDQGTRTVILPRVVFQSPDEVMAYGIWCVRQNWHLAGRRKVLAGEA